MKEKPSMYNSRQKTKKILNLYTGSDFAVFLICAISPLIKQDSQQVTSLWIVLFY